MNYADLLVQMGSGLGYGSERDPRRRRQMPELAPTQWREGLPLPRSAFAEPEPDPTTDTLLGLMRGPTAFALKQMKDLGAIPGQAEEAWGTVSHPADVYRGTADPNDVGKAFGIAGIAQTGGLGGVAAGAGETVLGAAAPRKTAAAAAVDPAAELQSLQRIYGTANPGDALPYGLRMDMLRRGRPDVFVPDPPAPALADSRVSGRVPTGRGAVESSSQDLLADIPSMAQTPEYFQKVADSFDPILPVALRNAPAADKIEAAKSFIANNQEELIRRSPDELIERAPSWYYGGRRIIDRFSDRWGIPEESVGGMFARLSPSTEWNQNVEMARRIGDTLHEDPLVDMAIRDAIANSGSALAKDAPRLDPFIGSRLSDIPDREAAAIAAFGHDRMTRPRSYNELSPEGNELELALTGKGEPQKLGTQSLYNMGGAVGAYRAGGNVPEISDILGQVHKIRNFYNDLIAPWKGYRRGEVPATKEFYPDYTNDTHNIAGGLMLPVGSSHPMTSMGLGTGGPGSDVTGMRGQYGVFADAGREVARRIGQPDPSAAQSMSWEAIRRMMSPAWKRQATKAPHEKGFKEMDAIWNRYREGDWSEDRARAEIFDYLNRVSPPENPGWMGR